MKSVIIASITMCPQELQFDDEEKVIIYALGSLEYKPLKSKLKLEKLLFLLSNVFKDYRDILEFEPHLFGPHSEIVESTLTHLKKLNIIKQEGNTFELTQFGKSIYSQLSPSSDLLKVLNDFKEFLNDLTNDEVMAFIYVTYPKYISESAKWDELKKNRINIAISLLKKEKVSFSKAAEISGLTAIEFERLLKSKGVKWR